MSEGVSEQDGDYDRRENPEDQLRGLMENIDKLRRENEELQKKIAIIYEFKKQDNRDDRNYYKVRVY